MGYVYDCFSYQGFGGGRRGGKDHVPSYIPFLRQAPASQQTQRGQQFPVSGQSTEPLTDPSLDAQWFQGLQSCVNLQRHQAQKLQPETTDPRSHGPKQKMSQMEGYSQMSPWTPVSSSRPGSLRRRGPWVVQVGLWAGGASLT